MKAISIAPGVAKSLELEERAEPARDDTTLLVETMALGVCGTDREIIAGLYGWAPAGRERLVLGHESLGRVLAAPANSGFDTDDLVVGIVRHPDPAPCGPCAAGEWDMCLNGNYTEHGIKALDGFGAERFNLAPDFAVRVAPALGMLGVLLEPASVLAKAWDHIDRIGARTASWKPHSALVTGAGPVGLLAALMAVQRGLGLHVFDRSGAGEKPALVSALGGTLHTGALPADLRADIVIECSGAPDLVLDLVCRAGGNAIVCLTGISAAGHRLQLDAGAFNRRTILENNVIFGTVNANRAHYEAAARSLAQADPAWLARLITRRVPLAHWQDAFERREGDIKVVIDFAPAAT